MGLSITKFDMALRFVDFCVNQFKSFNIYLRFIKQRNVSLQTTTVLCYTLLYRPMLEKYKFLFENSQSSEVEGISSLWSY